MVTLGGTERRELIAGRYELGMEVGRGATGTVWEAWEQPAGRAVAIKILHERLLTSAPTRRRFLREVELASTLRHPHCVEVLAHGDDGDGRVYLVMERLVGRTLAGRLRETGPLAQQDAMKIAAQVLDAVGAAHAAQIVHRDLKPANVMLIERDADRDFVKVCDFGLAKAIAFEPASDDDPNRQLVEFASLSTAEGAICGTPEYMAPEQARGEILDGRADLYSVAILLYQALVGSLPFRSPSPLAVVSLQLTAKPQRPSERRPDLGIYPPLENLILRALSKDRAERPSSAAVFRADLLQIARDHARRARRTKAPEADPSPTLPSSTSRFPRARMAGIVGLALALTTFGGWRLRAWINRSTALANAAPQQLAPSPHSAPESPPPPGSPVVLPPGPPVASPPSRQPRTAEVRPAWHKPHLRTSRETPGGDWPEEMVRAAEQRLGAGEIAEACALGQSAIEAHPESPQAWHFLGRCRMRRGEREAARTAFRRYLELAPKADDESFIRAILEEAR
jgi:eukaryotic-like serine/threonine-protein kinase